MSKVAASLRTHLKEVPYIRRPRLVLAYKNFAAHKGVSHIGLGVAADNTARTLRSKGHDVEVWPVTSLADIEDRIHQDATAKHLKSPISNLVISAPWIPTDQMEGFLGRHPHILTTVVSHSNIGFLFADPTGIRILREAKGLQERFQNFSVSGNSQRFCDAWRLMFNTEVRFLPNLYDVSTFKDVTTAHSHRGRALHIGVFGAIRPLKNMLSAVAAAIIIAQNFDKHVHIHISTGRDEGGATVQRAMEQLTSGLEKVRLIKDTWRNHDQFRQLVGSMDLLMQPSYTESFNMVTADGVAEGVPSVTSNAIVWAPKTWQAMVDDPVNISSVGKRLLLERGEQVLKGQKALKSYVHQGYELDWRPFLEEGVRHG